MCSFGVPCNLRRDILPTKLDIYNYYLYLNQEKLIKGEWKQNTQFYDKAKFVSDEVEGIWERTGIPHHKLKGKEGVRKISYLLVQCKELTKVAKNKRKPGFGKEFETLFDVAMCTHVGEHCTCDLECRVPLTWKAFLTDQRGGRKLEGVLSDRTLSLRAAVSRENQEQEARELIRYKVEELERKKRQDEERSERSKLDIELLLQKVPLTDRLIEEFEDGDGDVEVNAEADQVADEEEEDDDGDDSDWEDIGQLAPAEEGTSKYNTMSLKHFSRECDRYGISDRAGAKVGNALLKDLGIVKRGSTSMLICPSKVRRERVKWGEKLVTEQKGRQLPSGLYTDGKRVPTLNRQTTVTKVRVPGRRGRAAWRNVTHTSNTLVVEDHYHVLAQPGGDYVTHVTPEDGTGRALAKELVAVIKERKCDTG